MKGGWWNMYHQETGNREDAIWVFLSTSGAPSWSYA